jgi:hypothetical protein
VDPISDKCHFTLSNAPASFGSAGGNGSVSITTARDCTWSVKSEAAWVSVMTTAEGQGPGTVSYVVQENQAPTSRASAIDIADQRVLLSQAAAPCRFRLSQTEARIESAGGTLSFEVSALNGCPWKATASDSWIVVAPASAGATVVVVSVAANPGAERVGRIAVADQTYTVTQSGAVPLPAPAPAPTPAPLPGPTPTDPSPPEPTPTQTQVSGTISAITGKCPTVSFLVTQRSVVTRSETVYTHGKCTDLSNDDDVAVEGLAVSGGVITATSINIKKNR